MMSQYLQWRYFKINSFGYMVVLNITWKYFAVSWLNTSPQMVIGTIERIQKSLDFLNRCET